MGKETAIAWTDHTFNPHWGCQRVSPGCENCYAERFSHRLGLKVWGPGDRREFGDKHWTEPLRWNKAARLAEVPAKVFCASMADIFEDHPVAARSRTRLWELISETPWLTWQLLTKRPENIDHMMPRILMGQNVWLGTTVEDQKRANERISHLVAVPARVRFLSCEPLLGPVNLFAATRDLPGTTRNCEFSARNTAFADYIQWVIVGGESGPGSREFDLVWARSIVSQCAEAGVACFVKQMGTKPLVSHATGDAVNLIRLRDKKGGDWNEWPSDLRVRGFPGSF